MTGLDWAIVLGLGLLVFGFAAARSRKTTTGLDWFLSGRNLPFWIAGISMFATSVDGGEYISINGATYKDGLSMMTGMTLGVVAGGLTAAFLVVPVIYRAGMFTNAEYLETRYSPSVRIISVAVQIQYRTSVLATIAIALHLIFIEVAGMTTTLAWAAVVTIAAATTLFAAKGGLKTVAQTDAILGCAMLSASAALWWTIWRAAGGWDGAAARITAQEGPHRAQQLLHIGSPSPGENHPLVVILGWILILTGYFVVNHTQTMKMLGVRSLWDLKMSVIVGTALIMISGLFSSTIGIFGRALLPGLEQPDLIYPRLVDMYLGPGLKGLVVAGVIASAVSTFEGIGAALSALFTRDVYARLFVPNAPDEHYLRISRWATVAFVAVSFAYIPFMLRSTNIVTFFVRITSVFVTPLMTIYLVGVLTPVHRRSGLVGLLVGSMYGLIAAFGDGSDALPSWFTEKFAAYAWSTILTATAMLAASILLGWDSVRGASDRLIPDPAPTNGKNLSPVTSSFRREENPILSWWANPNLWAATLLTISSFLVFYVLW
jgi:SSS family solute:Na+ symporter